MIRPTTVVLAERVLLVLGLLAIVVGVALFDWRVALILLGLICVGLVADIRWPAR